MRVKSAMTRVNERHYAVLLNDRHVGMLHAHDDQTRFVIDGEYARDPSRAVLGLMFEQDLAAQHRANMRLPPWFSNLLPEGRLREWIAKARGVSAQREIELLAQVGHDLPGAVRVVATEGSVGKPVTPRREITAEAVKEAPASVWRFSLAGVALKFSMLGRGDRLTAPGVGEDGDWIVKLPDPNYAQVPSNEHAMMELGRLSGLDVPETRLVHRDQIAGIPGELWHRDEELAYAVRRFDRAPGGRRVHMEDLAQVRGFYPDDKYRGSFETVGALIYRGHDKRSLIEFTSRLAFNVLIGNGDAHLKNWTLLYADPRIPILSPAYDLVATAAYQPTSITEDLGLTFGGSRRFENVSLTKFASLERKLNAAEVSLTEEVRALTLRVQSAWPQIEQLLELYPALRQSIGEELQRRSQWLLRS